ncbi:MAG: hypothetical protein V3U87_00470 [Methylococcaceae bacterium]
MKKIKQRVLRIVWIALLIIINITSSNASEWKVNAGIDQNISYDDNVIMREEPEASLIYKVTPSVNLSHKTDVSNLSAYASYGVQRFFDIEDLNRNHQHYGIQGEYNTERTTWELDSLYSSAPARNTAGLESGDFETDADRKTFSISPTVSYQLTEQDRLSLSAQYTNTRFEVSDSEQRLLPIICGVKTDIGAVVDSACGLNKYEDVSVRLLWLRQWTERYSSTLNVFYSNYDSSKIFLDDNTKSDSTGLNISSTYLLYENLELFGTVGYRATKTNRDSIETDSDGFLFDIGAKYNDINWLAELKVNKSLVPSSQGSLNDQTKVSVDLQYKFTERLYASLLSNYQISESVEGQGLNKRTNITFHPTLSWKLNPDWTVSTSYRYRYQERFLRSSGAEEEADSNLYMLSIHYRWQGLNIAR